MTIREELLSILEEVRTVSDDCGFRRYQVFLVVQTHTGNIGKGQRLTTTEEETELTNAGSPPRVRQVAQRDVVASGGLLQSSDLKIGPLTWNHSTGGTSFADFNPTLSSGEEVYFRLKGDEFGEEGVLFKKVETRTDKPLSISFIVRRVG